MRSERLALAAFVALAACTLAATSAAAQDTVRAPAPPLLPALPPLPVVPALLMPAEPSVVVPPADLEIRSELPASAMRATLPQQNSRLPRGLLGVELSLVEPRGEFARFVDKSFGFAIQGLVALDRRGTFALGGDIRSVAYDSKEYQDTVTVKNMMRTFTVGSRYTLPIPFVRPYVGGAIGAAYFGTETSVRTWQWNDEEDEWQQETVLQGVKNARMTYTLVRSLGLQMDLWQDRRGATPMTLSLDVGVSDHSGGRTSYLTSGRGPRVRSATDYRVYRIGLSFRSR